MHINLKKSLLFIMFLCSLQFIFSRPKESLLNENPDNNYYKYIHPREYVFDLCDAKEKIVLKFDDSTGKLKCNVDFTDLVKTEMPRKGDKITFKFEGTASKNVLNVLAYIYDIKNAKNIGNKIPEILVKPTQKGVTFTNTISFILTENAENSLVLTLTSAVPDGNKKSDKVEFKFKRVCNSTNTKVENDELKKAIKEKKNIIEVPSDFSNELKSKTQESNQDVPEENSTENTLEDSDTTVEETAEVPAEELKDSPSPSEEKSELSVETEKTKEPVEEAKEDLIKEPVKEVTIEPQTETELKNKADSEDKSQPKEENILEEKSESKEQIAEISTPVAEITTPVAEITTPVAKVTTPVAEVQEEKIEKPQVKVAPVVKTPVTRYKKEYLHDYEVRDPVVVEDEFVDLKLKYENPDEYNSFGRTLLMEAAKAGNDWQIKNLIESGANVNLKDKEGWTALMYAVRYQDNYNCVELLLDAGASVKDSNKFDTSALKLAACYNNNPQIIKKLLSYYTVSEKEVLSSLILLLTENNNSVDLQGAKLIIFLESSIPVNTFYNGKTPLMYAAQYCESTYILKLLMEYGAVTSIRSSDNKTAFDYAKENANLKHDEIYWSLNKK